MVTSLSRRLFMPGNAQRHKLVHTRTIGAEKQRSRHGGGGEKQEAFHIERACRTSEHASGIGS